MALVKLGVQSCVTVHRTQEVTAAARLAAAFFGQE